MQSVRAVNYIYKNYYFFWEYSFILRSKIQTPLGLRPWNFLYRNIFSRGGAYKIYFVCLWIWCVVRRNSCRISPQSEFVGFMGIIEFCCGLKFLQFVMNINCEKIFVSFHFGHYKNLLESHFSCRNESSIQGFSQRRPGIFWTFSIRKMNNFKKYEELFVVSLGCQLYKNHYFFKESPFILRFEIRPPLCLWLRSWLYLIFLRFTQKYKNDAKRCFTP